MEVWSLRGRTPKKKWRLIVAGKIRLVEAGKQICSGSAYQPSLSPKPYAKNNNYIILN